MYDRAPAARRLADARRRAGKSVSEIATAIGLDIAACSDLESYDDEVYTSISLGALCRLADLLGVTAGSLVAPSHAPGDGKIPPVRPAELARRLGEQMRERGESVEAAGGRLGWDVEELLAAPDRPWAVCNLDGLQDLCRSVRLSWLGVLATWPGARAVWWDVAAPGQAAA